MIETYKNPVLLLPDEQSVFDTAHAYGIETLAISNYNQLHGDLKDKYLRSINSQVFEINISNPRLDTDKLLSDQTVSIFLIAIESAIFNYRAEVSDTELKRFIQFKAINACNFYLFEDRLELMLTELESQIVNEFTYRHVLRQFEKASKVSHQFTSHLNAVIYGEQDDVETTEPTENVSNITKPTGMVTRLKAQLVAIFTNQH